MKVTLLKPQTFNIKYIIADFGVRYFEDSTINGVEDDDINPKMPCVVDRFGDKRWIIKVDIDTGEVVGWPKDTVADIHYKICDDGHYSLLNEQNDIIEEFDSYVPDVFAINDSGYGDYVIMTIDRDGFIENWQCTSEDIIDMIDRQFDND